MEKVEDPNQVDVAATVYGWLRLTSEDYGELPLDQNDVKNLPIHLDSFDLLGLISFCEQQYKLVIPGAEFVPENFCSIGAVARLIDRLLTNGENG